jgi:hypothetical protein
LVKTTNSVARGSIRRPTISIEARIWTSSYLRNPDPVPTVDSVSSRIKCICIYKREQPFLTFTPNEKCSTAPLDI